MRYFRSFLTFAALSFAPTVGAFAQQAIANSTQNSAAVSNESQPQTPTTDLFALMTGRCSTLKVAGREFSCRTVAYVHNVKGRVNFTIPLDDSDDRHHIISFSGEHGQRSNENLYDLTIDRMLLNSNDRPKVDGLPVADAVSSHGRCVQLGNFGGGHVSSIVCSAIDQSGNRYELRFESDGSPITFRRVNPSAPTIRQNS
jgi:hypothetical protein